MSIFSLGENNPIEGLRGSGEFELFLVDFANRLKIEQEDIDNTFAAVSQFVEETGKRYADTTNMLGSMADVNVHRVTSQEQRTQEIVDRMSGETILSTSSYQMLDTDPKNSTIDKISDELKAEDKDFWQTDQSKQARIDDAQARLEIIYEAEDDQFALGA